MVYDFDMPLNFSTQWVKFMIKELTYKIDVSLQGKFLTNDASA
jgi:hypothetical protein